MCVVHCEWESTIAPAKRRTNRGHAVGDNDVCWLLLRPSLLLLAFCGDRKISISNFRTENAIKEGPDWCADDWDENATIVSHLKWIGTSSLLAELDSFRGSHIWCLFLTWDKSATENAVYIARDSYQTNLNSLFIICELPTKVFIERQHHELNGTKGRIFCWIVFASIRA